MTEIQTNYNHVRKFEVTIALVGTMKAGKSTVINALVGKELAPHRALSMTVVPTVITHNSKTKDPELTIPHPNYYNDAIDYIVSMEKVSYNFEI